MAKLKKPKKLKALAPVGAPHMANQLAKAGRISTKALKKFKLKKPRRGSQIPLVAPRGGVGKGMAGM